jgi:hypothetical protein
MSDRVEDKKSVYCSLFCFVINVYNLGLVEMIEANIPVLLFFNFMDSYAKSVQFN